MRFRPLIHTLAPLLAAAGLATAASAAVPVYPTPGSENPATYNFTAANDGDIIAYFAGMDAGDSSVLGLFVNGVDTGVWGLNNHSTTVGTALNFGAVSAGDALTFVLHDLSTSSYYYSDPALNGGRNHVYSDLYGGGDFGLPAGVFVAFEDRPIASSDKDYNDFLYVFTNVSQTAAVPEPATWALLIAGFGLVGVAFRRRRTGLVRHHC